MPPLKKRGGYFYYFMCVTFSCMYVCVPHAFSGYPGTGATVSCELGIEPGSSGKAASAALLATEPSL